MKLDCNVKNLQVITKKVVQGKKQNNDGSTNTYYMLGIRNSAGDDHADVGCTLAVYDQVQLDKFYDFHFFFETRFDKVFVKFDEVYPSSDKLK